MRCAGAVLAPATGSMGAIGSGRCGLRRCQRFQSLQVRHGFCALAAAHGSVWLQAGADGRAPRLTKNKAALVRAQLHTAHTGRLAIRHSRNEFLFLP